MAIVTLSIAQRVLKWHSVTGFIFVSYAGGPFKLRIASILHGQLPYYIRVF